MITIYLIFLLASVLKDIICFSVQVAGYQPQFFLIRQKREDVRQSPFSFLVIVRFAGDIYLRIFRTINLLMKSEGKQ